MINTRLAFIRVGYCWIPPISHKLPQELSRYKGIKFTKQYSTSAGEFEVLLIVRKPDLTKLPVAYILRKPLELQGKALPHIRNDGFLCYASNDQAEWNPMVPFELAHAIDRSIKATLQSSIDNIDNSTEYNNEFSNYWESHFLAYSFEPLPTKSRRLKYCSLEAKTGSKSLPYTEFLLFNNDEERDRWLELRNVKSIAEEGQAIIVNVKPNRWAPTEQWPPSSLAQTLNWLTYADRSAHDFLIFQLVQLAARKALVILQITNEGVLGFKIEFSAKHHKLLTTWKSRKTRSIKLMTVPISSPKAAMQFYRHRIEQIDRDSVFLRNRPDPNVGDIRHLRIALIGCGTIGGFVAEHLVKLGAGIGAQGNLTLYDSDDLNSGNLSRHRLPARYLGWNKADALSTMLSEDSLHPIKLSSKCEDFSIDVENLGKYDVVIDATGRSPVSLKIASTIREMGEVSRPIVIHSFNDQWGQESVVFIDAGKACYGCMDKTASASHIEPDFDPSRYSCGSIYTPYDASVSIVSAGLVADAVLSVLEPKLKWTLTKVTSNNTNSQKRQILRPWSKCVICGERVKHG